MQGQNCLTVERAENLESSFLNGDFELWDVCVSMGKNWLLLMLPQSPIDQQREVKEREKERGGQSRVRTPILHCNLAIGNQPARQTLSSRLVLSSSPFTPIHLGKHPPTH